MALSTDSMVGTSWGMHLGMTGTGMLTGSDEPEGRCTLILISFLFFLAKGRGKKRKEVLGRGMVISASHFTFFALTKCSCYQYLTYLNKSHSLFRVGVGKHWLIYCKFHNVFMAWFKARVPKVLAASGAREVIYNKYIKSFQSSSSFEIQSKI